MSDTNPFLIASQRAEAPLLGTLVALLTATRHFTISASRGLTAPELDAKPAGARNSIGSILSHIAAAETMFQNISFHGRRFGEDETQLAQAFAFERNPLEGSDVDAYHGLLGQTRAESERLLASVDDDWLSTPKTFAGLESNLHYYWTHLALDEARHTGQVTLIRKYLLGRAQAGFNPYVPPEMLQT